MSDGRHKARISCGEHSISAVSDQGPLQAIQALFRYLPEWAMNDTIDYDPLMEVAE